MRGLRIGRRRGRGEHAASPLELALRPALSGGRWQVPDRFNLAKDVVEALATDPKRTALTSLGKDGVIEPRTFLEIAEGAARQATALLEQGVHPKDRVLVVADTSVGWIETVLGVLKVGAVTVPCPPAISAPALEALFSSVDASLVVAEPECRATIEQMSFEPGVLYLEHGPRKKSSDTLKATPTAATSSRDLAFVFVTPGTGGAPRLVPHTHGAVFASRMQAEHWLDAGRGDLVWCTVGADSPLAAWFTLAGPWSRGADVVVHHGEFDPQERLEHLYRLGPSILCQSAAEYRALASHDKLERFRSPRLRRLVSTGDVLDPEVREVFQERWGLPIHDGYGQAETGIVVANGHEEHARPGTIGRPLPGYDVAIVDDQGNELPPGVEGDLALRGRPPTLFAGYWESPEETKRAFRGDTYLTGDVVVADEEGFLTFVARAEDVITSSGRTFGPYEVEHVLRSHDAIRDGAVVGIRDLQRGGHFVRAFVVPAPKLEGSAELEAELRQFLGQVLPEQQVPREIVFVDELPFVNGRLSRAELRELPLPGRPLWEMPPTSEPDAEPEPARSQAAAEPPTLLVAPAAAAALAEPEPPPVVEIAPEPVVFVSDPEPVVVLPEPAAALEPIVEPEPIVVEPLPVPEPVPVPPEPAPVLLAPEPEPVVVELEPEPVVEPEPVAEAHPVSPAEPEPAVFVVAPEPEPEPEREPEPEPEPEPVAKAAPQPEPEPEPVPEREPVAGPQIEREPVAEAAIEPEPEPEPEPVAEPQIEPEPQEPEVVQKPALRVVTPLQEEPQAEAATEAEDAAPASAPEPLPDYVVAPSEAASAPPPPPPPEPEPEPDLGPLPDYIVDPSLPPEARPKKERRQSAPVTPTGFGLTPAPPSQPTEEESRAAAAGIYFPPVTSFPVPRADEDDETDTPKERRKAPRRRTPADTEATKAKAKRSQEEPGDDVEAGWMAGLSNRLSAYSLAEEAEQADEEPGEDNKASDAGA